MFSLGKLLSETPEKVVGLVLALIKLIITLWLASKLGSPFKADNFNIDSFFINIDVLGALYYLVCSVSICFFLWGILELIINLFIHLVSLKIADENALKYYLTMIRAVKYDGDKFTEINSNIRLFTELLENKDQNPFIIKIEYEKVFGVSLIAYILLLNSGNIHLFSWQFWLATLFLFSIFVIGLLQYKWTLYYKNNSPKIQNEFYAVGKKQELIDILEMIDYIKDNYVFEVGRKKITIQKNEKCEIEWIPKEIEFIPVFIPDEEIGKRDWNDFSEKITKPEDGEKYVVFVTNIEKYDVPSYFVNEQLIIITAKNINQIYNRVKDFIDSRAKKYYSSEKNVSEKKKN